MSFVAQLEPDALLQAFAAHPPVGFEVRRWQGGLPLFDAGFDLLTTADDALRKRVNAWPLHSTWGRLLKWQTRFFGSTVSEYALLDAAQEPEHFAARLLQEQARARRLFIVKDLAAASPLLTAPENDYAARVAQALQARGFVLLQGQALAWLPVDFADEADYLSRLSYSRRKDMRRKLRTRQQLQIESLRTGATCFDDAQTLAQFYRLYEAVYAQSEIHFDKLSPDFLRCILQDADSGGLVFVYRHDGRMIGWNLCYEYRGMLIDKYIGLAYPQARALNLYFVSWMVNLDYARQRGLTHYVAGWTDPQVKASLDAQFSFTRHAVYARNPCLRFALKRIGRFFESDRQWHEQQS